MTMALEAATACESRYPAASAESTTSPARSLLLRRRRLTQSVTVHQVAHRAPRELAIDPEHELHQVALEAARQVAEDIRVICPGKACGAARKDRLGVGHLSRSLKLAGVPGCR